MTGRRSAIRQILLADWDPSDAIRNEASHGTYDAYIEPLLKLFETGGDEESVIAFLRERELESMCFPAIGVSHLKRVAQKLLRATGTADNS